MTGKYSHNNLINRYNNLKMSILDKAQIGNSVQVNLELSKDRLNKETVEAINISPVEKIILYYQMS